MTAPEVPGRRTSGKISRHPVVVTQRDPDALPYSSHNQLLYSLRSVMQNMKFIRRGTMLATSLMAASPPEASNVDTTQMDSEAGCRVMQRPLWLNTSITSSSHKLRVLPHWELFHTHLVDDVHQWRRNTLPVFNR